jgi:hypothetical protein
MAANKKMLLGGFSRALTLVTCLLLPALGHAHSAVAWVQAHPVSTNYASWNYPTQKIADAAALDGCRKAAKENGLTKEAPKCKVMHRQKGRGAGAVVCGKTGCSMSTGYDTEQDAADKAFLQCQQKGFGECRGTDITSWWDDAGYPKPAPEVASMGKTCGPPPGRTVRSTYQCNNGDCTRTYENGCTVRFQAPYCRDPATGKGEWKADGC